MSMMDLFIINSDGELGDLLNLFQNDDETPLGMMDDYRKKLRLMKGKSQSKTGFIEQLYKKYDTRDPDELWHKILRKEHCSAIVKVIRDDDDKLEDILISHSTWTDYSEMLRIYKYYDFDFLGDNEALPSH